MSPAQPSLRPTLAHASVRRYYCASLLGLRRLDDASIPRPRFDLDADARWSHLAGPLTTAPRIGLLLRDAAVRFGPAFHAAQVFGIAGLASDEPFGPTWISVSPQDAQDLWQSARAAPRREGEGLLAAFGDALKIAPPPETPNIPLLRTGERV